MFVRIADILEMQEAYDRPFHGPEGAFPLPEGLTVTLTGDLALGTWIRAVGEAADRLRRIVRGDWQSGSFSIGDPLI